MCPRSQVVLALVLAASASACEEKKSTSDSAQADASAGKDKYATADPKLEKALQAAASTSASSESGPPPDGVFAPGAGDQRHPAGTPTKVDVVSEGTDPRVSLDPGPGAPASSYGPAMLRLGLQMGQRVAMPTVDLALVLGAAKKDEGGSDVLLIDVKKAAPDKEQLGQLPAGTDKEIATLDGTAVRMKATADGRESDLQVVLGKGTNPELDRLAQGAAEALVFSVVPLPSKPVGAGAQWIAETRMPLAGADAIAYRAYKVKSITGNRVRLSLDVKAYSTTNEIRLPGVPAGAKLEQFLAEAQGELELARGEAVARMSDVQQRVVMVFSNGSGAGAAAQNGGPAGAVPGAGMLTAQFQSQATLVRGEDLRSASKP
jgi:hypothetical protein